MPKKIIADTFLDIANAIESGEFGKKVRVGLTTLGSEHGTENLVKGAHLAKSNLFDIVLIGPKVDTDLEVVEVNDESEMHSKMEELLDSGYIDACVTMHYNFPIGVSTVGRVITPGRGKEMILATTTGTSATHRIEAMVRNAVYGISTAKSIGIKNPTVGILNVDGARQVEKALKDLQSNGYDISFAESVRADGGCVMRGNDLLCGAPDVMVTDTLSGNIFMKVFSSFTTGGDYEANGFGYGPGVGEDYDRKILILSRASGSPVVANALRYAYDVVKGDVTKVSKKEFKAAKNAKYDDIIAALTKKEVKKDDEEEVKMPEKEVVTHQISGIDIMDLEDAVKVLWKNGIYAESGMGCTGPIVLVAEGKGEVCVKLLLDSGYTAK
ncbi:glycine/sarcosine/betaine reductase complex component C subunit alpha [Paraclostridium sordellii]|uniref:glycine/sarcosine/betaine reductase complex component C subunit alpha n=1 Tax=Paraclostridium sordellii TaxID=1505 RepID=UPI0005DE9C28|nr:glycine/sarcosine/betaine reductase complex component C subunit alpha [Paeniclostridium sordellii]MCQ4697355.1 glycine/sarcosine/betaine reductase complex component C subunit alpha [Paeniclostridium sordellii]MDU4413659.1 glycine/sarcosine/betaine reductase complex component C subunit alpha [Paeniclostridium sordellii]MDU6482836.1 glycine/sarcosine/betaine reductase complex component C subunit alpha [Paeniclostridium sordellii]MRZ28257.1 glycine reductase [Paeniclostridium sordellii]MRZ8096